MFKHTIKYIVLSLVNSLLLSSCLMVGPDYQEPMKPVSDTWLDPDKSVKHSTINNANWWQVFHDSTLTSLIFQGYQSNLSIQSAAAHVLQLRAQLAQSVGELYPQQQALMGNLTYNRIGGSSLQDVLPPTFDTAVLGASASWEIDFWGKYRRAILSNDANFLASFAAYDNALVSLTSDIASVYIDIRTTEQLIIVTEKNIKLQTIALKLANARFTAGQASLQDVEQAQTELSQTQAIIPKYVSQLRQEKDKLGVLLGVTPDKVEGFLGKHLPIPSVPSSVAVGIPKEALAKRPDIYQARMQAIAQSETIGAVKANLYPSLTLAGNFNFSSNTIGSSSLSDLFSWSNRGATAGPAFNWPILNYGQITNAVREQDAAFEQALLNYLNLVLKAQQEVQDAITLFIETKHSADYLKTANRSAVKSTQLAIIRYREGETDFTPVLDAERQQLQVETSLTTAMGEIPKALVSLYRALGGGWQIRGCQDIVPLSMKQQMSTRTNWGNLLKQSNHQPASTKQQQIKRRYLPTW